MLKSKQSLFEDSEGEDGELHINTAYATKYEEWRRGEELQKLKDRYGEDVHLSSDSESSSDGDYVEPDNPEFDRDFLRTLGALHNNTDTQLKGAAFFTGNYRKKKEKEEEEKAMTLKDYERHIILDRGGELEEEENPVPMRRSHSDNPLKGNKITSFEDNINSDSDSDGDGLLTSGLFKVKEPNCAKKEKMAEVVDDAVAFIKGENSVIKDAKDKDLLQGLREAWNDPEMSENDKWLADFFLNKRYLEEEDESVERAYNEAVIDEETLSEDEKTLQTMETFETKYRFRYEEPDEEFIKKYPRIIPNSVRAKDERRKLKREAIKERKLKEKELKRQEIQRLKALKYKEIEAKIERIKEASGNMDIDLGDKDFDEEFDEAAHEQTMSRMFGDDYYAIDDEDAEKPVFEDDDDDYVIQDYDDWVERQGPSISGTGENCGWKGEDEDYYMDDDEDADYDESRQTLQQEMISHSTKKKTRRKSKFAQAIKQKKPVFDPNEKNFQSYFEEYYRLDFEDIVGGIPCRFKYRKVEPNSFGLSTEEILTAQDKELNSWYSLKKMFKHDRSAEEEQHDRSKFSKHFFQTHLKHKTLPSLFVEDPEQLQIDEEEKKRLKNLKKKLRKQQKLKGNVKADASNQRTLGHWDTSSKVAGLTEDNEDQLVEYSNEKQTKKKRKREEHCLSNSTEDLSSRNLEDESSFNTGNNETPTGETREKRKRKKKKKSGGQESITQENTQNNEVGNTSASDMSKMAKISCGSTLEKETMPHDPNGMYNSAVPEDTGNKFTPSTGKSKKKKKKKKPKKETQGEHSSGLQLMNKGRKSSTAQKDNSFFQGISDTRLAAYGENPKKLKNKFKYGKKKF